MVSVIMFYHEKNLIRRNNLLFVIDYINKLNFEKEIIVIEQGLEKKYEKSYFYYSDGDFNKSKAYNYGVEKSKYDILMFCDADIIFKENIYYSAIENINKLNIIKPYRYLISLDEEQTNIFKKDLLFNYENNKILQDVGGGGLFFIKKEIFNKIGGFDERCVGSGYEDDIFDIRVLLNDLEFTFFNDFGYHLYHEREQKNYITKNRDLFLTYLLVLYNTKIKSQLGKLKIDKYY